MDILSLLMWHGFCSVFISFLVTLARLTFLSTTSWTTISLKTLPSAYFSSKWHALSINQKSEKEKI